MIDSFFILSGTGTFVVERHFRGPAPRNLVEPFVEKLRSTEAPSEIPGVLAASRRHALVHIMREKMFFLAVVTREGPPMAVFELLERVHQVLARYLGDVTEDSLRQNFSTVYLLLDEMVDSGFPFTTELNALESIIAPPSVMSKVVQAVSGSSSQVLSDVPPDTRGQSPAMAALSTAFSAHGHTQLGSASAEVWWRRQGVVYASNEIYVDVVEHIDCILDGNGHMVSGGIGGDIDVNSKLSGMPECVVSLRNPSALQNCSFHPCVRLHRLERDRALSFIPPDGEFRLASYWIPDTSIASNMPFNFSATIAYHSDQGRISITASPKLSVAVNNKQMLIDKFCVNVRLPSSIASVNLACQGGAVRFDEDDKVIVWRIGKLAGQDNKVEGSLLYATDPKDGTPIVPSEEKSTAQIAFVARGFAISGIKLDSCEVSGTSYTPYKASRYTTTAGRMEFRIA